MAFEEESISLMTDKQSSRVLKSTDLCSIVQRSVFLANWKSAVSFYLRR